MRRGERIPTGPSISVPLGLKLFPSCPISCPTALTYAWLNRVFRGVLSGVPWSTASRHRCTACTASMPRRLARHSNAASGSGKHRAHTRYSLRPFHHRVVLPQHTHSTLSHPRQPGSIDEVTPARPFAVPQTRGTCPQLGGRDWALSKTVWGYTPCSHQQETRRITSRFSAESVRLLCSRRWK
jgi:hypothetical protein